LDSIYKNLNSGFINEDDMVVMQRRIITRTYLLSWFVPDVLSSIPIELFIQSARSTQSDDHGGSTAHYARTSKTMKLMRMLKLMKVFRLMRVNRVFKYMRLASQWMSDRVGFTFNASTQGVIRIGKLFGMLLLLAHWIGCLNYMLCRIWDFPEESWVVQYNIEPGAATMGKQYTWSFFKAMQLMISSGMDSWGGSDNCMEVAVRSGNAIRHRESSQWCEVESWTMLVCLYIGTIFCALLISEVSSIIIDINREAQASAKLLQRTNQYMSAKNLPYETRWVGSKCSN
jgi:hypothetical protein